MSTTESLATAPHTTITQFCFLIINRRTDGQLTTPFNKQETNYIFSRSEGTEKEVPPFKAVSEAMRTLEKTSFLEVFFKGYVAFPLDRDVSRPSMECWAIEEAAFEPDTTFVEDIRQAWNGSFGKLEITNRSSLQGNRVTIRVIRQ